MNTCFTKEELSALMGEGGARILNDEEIARQETTICPFCGKKHFKYIGLGDFSAGNYFRCDNCSFRAEMKDLAEKDKMAVITDYFRHLNNLCARIQSTLKIIFGSLHYRP